MTDEKKEPTSTETAVNNFLVILVSLSFVVCLGLLVAGGLAIGKLIEFIWNL